jgi:hypothetical protein
MQIGLARLARLLATGGGLALLASITVSPVVAAAAPAVSINPSSFNYGTVAVGSNVFQSFVLTNTGTADLHLQGITFTGANPTAFRVSLAGCDYHTITPGATCMESVAFAPKEAGLLTANMNYPDDAAGSPQTVALTGTATGPVVAYAPATLDFPLIPVGQQSAPQTFYVKNVGDQPLTITSATPQNGGVGSIVVLADGCSGGTVQAGGNCRMSVAFRATQALSGGVTIRFQANTNPGFQDYHMSASGFGIYAQVYNPSSFGNQPQNSTSQPQYVQLQNAGGAPMHVGGVSVGGAGASQFAVTSDLCTGATVGAPCLVYFSFTPTTTGTSTATVTFTDDAPDSPQITTIRGTGIAPGAIPSPTAIDFGVVADGGGSASRLVQLANPTSQSLHVSSAAISSGGSQFTTSGDSCSSATVPPGAACSLTVKFTPLFAFAGNTGTLTFTDDAGFGQQVVSLAGQGVDPQITYSPNQVAFGNQRVTTRSTAQALTITNTSNSSWTPFTRPLRGANPGDFALDASGCTQSLAPGASCQLLLTFAPTTTGSRAAVVDVINPVTSSINQVPVTGTGIAPVIPATSGVVFGNQRVGATVTGYGLWLTNAGTDTLHVSGVSLSGPNAGAFAILAGTCIGGSVAPNSACSIPISFTPPSTGPFSATLNVVDDAWSGPSQVVLSGTGVQSHATFNPTSVTFTNAITGQPASQLIRVMSDGTASLNVASMTLSGSGAAAYSLSADTCSGQQWPATIGCSVTVTFAPTAYGSYPASLLVADDAAASPQSISLSGNYLQSNATVSPSTLAFGGLRPGNTASPQTVTLTNDGNSTVHVTTAALTGDPSFTLTADACSNAALAPEAICTVQVGFAPAASGPLQATLSFSDDAANAPQVVAVTGSGIQPAVSVAPSSLAFGNQLAGTTSPSRSVVVTNSGTDALNIGAAAVDAPFAIASDACSNAAVAPGSACTIQVNFTPTAPGDFSGTLSIQDDAPGSPHRVGLTGTGTNPHATASPASIAFGDVRVGTTASQTATLTNDGSMTIHLSAATLTGETIFSLTADACSGATLAAGAACTVQVNFAPLASSGPNQLATLTFNDDASNTPQTVALSGHAVQSLVSLSVSSLAFGNQLVGTTSASQSIVVTNSGSAALNIGTAAAGAPFALVSDGCSNTAVGSGSSCTIQVAFAPNAAGTASGTLSIPDDAAGSPHAVALSGTGLQPHATASPTAVSFGGVRVGNAAAPQTITLTNDGNTTLRVSSATLTGSSSFSLAANSCSGATLAAGATCTVQLGFAPANVGTFNATLSFSDDASNPQTVTIGGSGVMPAVSLSASSLAFGNQVVGTRSANQSVVVTNSGTGTLNAGTATVGAPFAIVSDTCSSGAVAPGSSCTIQLAFTPTATGPASGTLSIPDDASGSPHTVALSGTGVQPRATVSPSSLSFGSVHVGPGSAGAQQYVTLTNSGTADLHLASVTLAGNPAFTIGANCPVTTLAPGASCKVGIYGSPDTIGLRSGSLQISDDAPGSPQTVALSVTGLDGKLTAAPTSFNFGSVKVNSKSAKLTIKVQNTGNVSLTIGTVSITGQNASSFVIDSNSCAGKQLAVGASCSLTVYMKPLATGPLSASVTFINNGLGGTQYVALTGTGTR